MENHGGTLMALVQAIFRDLQIYGSVFHDNLNDEHPLLPNDNDLLLPIARWDVVDGVFRIYHKRVDSLILLIEPRDNTLIRSLKYIDSLK